MAITLDKTITRNSDNTITTTTNYNELNLKAGNLVDDIVTQTESNLASLETQVNTIASDALASQIAAENSASAALTSETNAAASELAASNYATFVEGARNHEALIDFSRVDSYVKEDGTRWLKNDGKGSDGEMKSGQMLSMEGTSKIPYSNEFTGTTYSYSASFISDGLVPVICNFNKGLVYLSNGKLYFRDTGNNNFGSTNSNLQDEGFHRFWVVVDDTILNIYIDGELDSTHTITPTNVDILGFKNAANYGVLKLSNICLIDNTALTAEDIALDYAQPELLCGVSTNTIQSPFSFDTNDILACFPLNEGTMGGGYVYDVKNYIVSSNNVDVKNNSISQIYLDNDIMDLYGFPPYSGVFSDDATYGRMATIGGTQTAGTKITHFAARSTQTNIDFYTFTSFYVKSSSGTVTVNDASLITNLTNGQTIPTTWTYVEVTPDSVYRLIEFISGTDNDTVSFTNFQFKSGLYPISNYDSTMWTNADNLPYGIQQTLLVKDDVNNFVTGISKYAVDSVTEFPTPTTSPYYALVATVGDEAITTTTNNSFNITMSSGNHASYPRVYSRWNSDGQYDANTWYKVSFDYNVNSGTAEIYGIYTGQGNLTESRKVLTGTGKITVLIYNTTQVNFSTIVGFLYFNSSTYNTFDIDISNIKIEKVEYSELPRIQALSHGTIQTNELLYKDGVFNGATLNFLIKYPNSSLRNTNTSSVIGYGTEFGLHNVAVADYIRTYVDGMASGDISIVDNTVLITMTADKYGSYKVYSNGSLVRAGGVSVDNVSYLFKIGEVETGLVNADASIYAPKFFRRCLTDFEVKELYNNIKTNAPSLQLP